MKNKHIPFLIYGFTGVIVCTLTYLYFCPGTLINLEANNPIFGAQDFLSETLRYPGGIISITSVWLTQWFYSPTAGSLICAVLTTIISLISGYITQLRQSHMLLAALPVLCVASTLVFPNVEALIQLLVAMLLLTGYTHLRNQGFSAAFGLCMLLFWPIIGTETSIALFWGLFGINLTFGRKLQDVVYPIVGIVCIWILLMLWSSNIAYIPKDERLTFNFKNFSNLIPLYTGLVPFCRRIRKTWSSKIRISFELVCYLIPVIAIPLHFFHHNTNGSEEIFYQMEQAAEQGNWLKVKSFTEDPQSWTNPLYLRYALLAESELGSLGNNLFQYPVHNITDLFFWQIKNYHKEYLFFNSLFYKTLGIADEYMHQIFEMGIISHAHMNARTIRHLTEAAIMQHDKPLAQKYYNLAKSSQKDPIWLQKTTAAISLMDKNDSSVPERSAFFIGTYLPQIEFVYIAMDDPNNSKRITYLLSCYLLDRNIKKFEEALIFFEEQLPDQLPKAFQEAYILARTMHPQLQLKFKINEEEAKEWINFLNWKNQKDIQKITQFYRYSYWYYYFFEQPIKRQ